MRKLFRCLAAAILLLEKMGQPQFRLAFSLERDLAYVDGTHVHPGVLHVAAPHVSQAKSRLSHFFSPTNNNGNVQTQQTISPGFNRTQSYTYDGVNRLTGASESGGTWSQTYGYEQFGNRWVTSSLGLGTLSLLTPTSSAAFNTATNRLQGGFWLHDAAGNQTRDAVNQQMAYDAENRMFSFTDPAVPADNRTYVYDGDGRRVRKTTPGGQRTVYVYDAFGRLAAEYSDSPPGGAGGTKYLTSDHLGSTRAVSDAAGTVTAYYDFTPFGDRIGSGVGGRPATYGADGGINQQFTGKERDVETGLDYFGARYFSGAQGRFTSPDPLMASARASNPHTWNRYAYVLNNPLRYVDPDGLEVPESCVQDQNCTIRVRVNVVYDKTVNTGKGLTAEQKKKFEQGQIAKAQNDYGTSNIKLDITYTAGSYKVGANGQPQLTGLRSDALNLVVSSGTPTGANGVSGVDKNTDTAVTFLNFTEVHDRNAFPLFTNTTEHELGHQFLGDVYSPLPPGIGGFFEYLGRESVVDSRVAAQAAGVSQQGFREGLQPRRYAVPLNPEANKPRQ